jgi:predicted alpha/beta hydrolase family esterase
MTTQVFLVQGGGEGAHAEDQELAASLQADLGAGYSVNFPKMPNESTPNYKIWSKDIDGRLAEIDGEIALVGHSVGGAILLKYLSEERVKASITGLFVLAAPYVNADENWHDDTAALRPDFGSRLSFLPHITLYHCHDDEVVPFAHLALYTAKLSQATIRRFPSGGHQFRGALSGVATDIRMLKDDSEYGRRV